MERVSDAVYFYESLIKTKTDACKLCKQGNKSKMSWWPAAGKAIKGKRDRFIVATKFGYVMRDGEPNRSQSAH